MNIESFICECGNEYFDEEDGQCADCILAAA